jgi:hypothetical protein
MRERERQRQRAKERDRERELKRETERDMFPSGFCIENLSDLCLKLKRRRKTMILL